MENQLEELKSKLDKLKESNKESLDEHLVNELDMIYTQKKAQMKQMDIFFQKIR